MLCHIRYTTTGLALSCQKYTIVGVANDIGCLISLMSLPPREMLLICCLPACRQEGTKRISARDRYRYLLDGSAICFPFPVRLRSAAFIITDRPLHASFHRRRPDISGYCRLHICLSTSSPLPLLLQRCNPWPHVANRHISISQLLSL